MAHYFGSNPVKIIRRSRNLIPTIPNRKSDGSSAFGERGFFDSYGGCIIFGGIITVDSLQATYNVISQKTWVANYPNYYRLTEYDLDIMQGTYTISVRATAGEKHRISIILGEVNTFGADGSATWIQLKNFGTKIKDEIITKTFTVNKPMKFALLVSAGVNAIGEDTGIATISEIMLNEGDTALPYEPYNQLWRVRSGALIRNPKNLFNTTYIHRNDFANCSEVEILDDNNVLIARGKSAGSTIQEYNYGRGWVRPLSWNSKTNGLSFKANDIVTVSADFTLIEKGDLDAKVRCYIYNSAGTIAMAYQNQKGISETTTRISWAFTIKADDTTYYPIFPINSNKVRIENIVINYGTTAEPYFIQD